MSKELDKYFLEQYGKKFHEIIQKDEITENELNYIKEHQAIKSASVIIVSKKFNLKGETNWAEWSKSIKSGEGITVKIKRKVKEIKFNWLYTYEDGERYSQYKVGEECAGKMVRRIEEYALDTKKSLWFYDVYFDDGTTERIFNANTVNYYEYEEEKYERDKI